MFVASSVFPLCEDGGDHRCDPSVTIRLVGGLGTQVLLIVVAPCFCEPALEELVPANDLLLLSNMRNGFWNVDVVWIVLVEIAST